jgi:hypothetical protein
MVKVFQGLVALWPVVLWGVGGAATLLLNVVATWGGDASLLAKLLTNATVDPLLAAWWPITRAFWGVLFLLGYPTSLDLLFG